MCVCEHFQSRSELSSSGRLRDVVGDKVHVIDRVREGEGEDSFEERGREKTVLQSKVK